MMHARDEVSVPKEFSFCNFSKEAPIITIKLVYKVCQRRYRYVNIKRSSENFQSGCNLSFSLLTDNMKYKKTDIRKQETQTQIPPNCKYISNFGFNQTTLMTKKNMVQTQQKIKMERYRILINKFSNTSSNTKLNRLVCFLFPIAYTHQRHAIWWRSHCLLIHEN